MPVKDLSGQKFGRLTVLNRDLTKKGGAAYWICQCDCGTIKSIRGTNLTATINPTRSCGCLAKEINSNKQDLTSLVNKRFGRLLVLERDLSKPRGKGHSSYWICQCDCGNKISVATGQLTSGKTQSCGCLRSELRTQKNVKNIANQRFGMVVAKERLTKKNNHNSYLWRCECDCGNKNYICSTESLLSGNIHSCGCNKKSMGEQIITNILQKNNINFISEYSFADLKSQKNHLLRFDFAIFENNQLIRLIEFDGEQHFNTRSPFFSNELVFNDQSKNEYCKSHNIPLVRIPYNELNNLSLELLMGDKYLI